MRRLIVLALFTLAAALATPALAQPQGKQKVISGPGAGELDLRDIKTRADGSVSGTVVNNTSSTMKGVRLLVKHTWYWKDERHPGEDSPGRSGYVDVSGDIAPAGSAGFTYTPHPPLPDRSDGTFKTTVSVQEFTQVGQ